MIKVRVRWCTCSLFITLGKLIVLLFLFCLPLLSFFVENSENKRNDLARPVKGTIFLVTYLLMWDGHWLFFQSPWIYYKDYCNNQTKQQHYRNCISASVYSQKESCILDTMILMVCILKITPAIIVIHCPWLTSTP